MYSERIKEAIADFSDIYEAAELSFKIAQPILGTLDTTLLNEFRYCVRGLREFVEELDTSSEDESLARLQRATHGAKNILNDSVDLLVGYAYQGIGEFNRIDTGTELIVYIPNLAKILESLATLHDQIAESRARPNNRVGLYKDISSSPEFDVVVGFCRMIPILRNKISVEQFRKIKSGKQFTITIVLTVLGLFIGILGIILAMLHL